jgi:hypothetical protein
MAEDTEARPITFMKTQKGRILKVPSTASAYEAGVAASKIEKGEALEKVKEEMNQSPTFNKQARGLDGSTSREEEI